jgi:hypothetical protein
MIKKCVHRANTLLWSTILKFKKFDTVDDLVIEHFQRWSKIDHQNLEGLRLALNSLSGDSATIVETGTSAYGTDSSRLFDSYVRNFGGKFYSVDINPYPSKRLKFAKCKKTHFFVMDSVQFLTKLDELIGKNSVDLAYLDSWDVDWSNPLPSAEHGKKELIALKPYLRAGTIVVVDDTPESINWIPFSDRPTAMAFLDEYGELPGKGAFLNSALQGVDFEVLYHDYNLVIRVNEVPFGI